MLHLALLYFWCMFQVSSLLSLVDILTSLAEEKAGDDADSIATCQMALFSLKLLCKLLGASHPQTFTKVSLVHIFSEMNQTPATGVFENI